jgi:hypothetical protein
LKAENLDIDQNCKNHRSDFGRILSTSVSVWRRTLDDGKPRDVI